MKTIIYQGDNRTRIKEFEKNAFDCVITSPPYYGLRDYDHSDQIGQGTLEQYINDLASLFDDIKEKMSDDGTLWINLGDSYAGSGKGRSADGTAWVAHNETNNKQKTNTGSILGNFTKSPIPDGLKAKDKFGAPWRVAMELQNRGWYLRQEIIWNKPNP